MKTKGKVNIMGIMSEIDLEGREGYMTAAMDISNSSPPSSAPAQFGNSEPIVRLGIDPHRYTRKPDDDDVKAIKMRMLKSTVTVPLSAVVKAIEQGQTICPAVIDGTHGSHAARFWLSQQIFCVDIDNAAEDKSRLPDDKYISIDKAQQILEDNSIKPFFIYRSFNYKKTEWGKPQEFAKYRICVRIDSVITDNTEREHIIKAFIALFGEAVDTGCKNADRIFFGSKPDCSVFEDINAITPKSVFLALYNKLFPSVNTPAAPKHSLPAPAVPAASSGDWSKEFDFDIDKLLYCLDPDSHYNTWISITAAYKGAGGDMETWVLWSKQSTKWKESDRKHWSVKGTSRGALINLAKQTPDGRKYMDDMKQAQAEAKRQYREAKRSEEWGKRIASAPQPDVTKKQEPEHPKELPVHPASYFGEYVADFIWYPYLPMGEYTILFADSGVGKNIVCCGIAANITAGKPLPGESSRTPSTVLFVSSEDDGAHIKKRIAACGGDTSKVYVSDRNDTANLELLGKDMGALEKTAQEFKPQLIIIDPWQAFLSATVDINRVNHVRPIMAKIALLAEKIGCSIILISHVNKRAQGENANYAASGSAELINACRSAFTIVYDNNPDYPEDRDSRILVHRECQSNSRKPHE